jgi:molybdopterin converting factor small subunit
MIEIKINNFALLAELFGRQKVVYVQPNTPVSQILSLLIAEKPESESVLRKSRIAINKQFVTEDVAINTAREIAILPPSSGG